MDNNFMNISPPLHVYSIKYADDYQRENIHKRMRYKKKIELIIDHINISQCIKHYLEI